MLCSRLETFPRQILKYSHSAEGKNHKIQDVAKLNLTHKVGSRLTESLDQWLLIEDAPRHAIKSLSMLEANQDSLIRPQGKLGRKGRSKPYQDHYHISICLTQNSCSGSLLRGKFQY